MLGGSFMRPRIRVGVLLAVCVAWAASASPSAAQDSPAAKATRKRLKTKISVECKEERLKGAVEDIQREMDDRVRIKIDTNSGISINSRVTVVAKEQPLEKILNDLCDKYDMGYYVVSDTKDRLDGWIILRKSKYKERGYPGKEKEKSSRDPRGPALGQAPPRPPEAAPAPRPIAPAFLARTSALR
jgi:hypothetical protein